MKILLTGASGGVATFLRPLLRDAGVYVRLSDLVESADQQPNEQFVAADLANADSLHQLVDGVDGIVHLGGQSVEAPWQTVLEANIIGTYNLFEAARQAQIRRLVFASTNHVVGFFERSETIDGSGPLRPDTRYGVSKAFGEALGAMYAYKHGLRVTSLRIGNVGLAPLDRRRLAIWIHPEDLMQLIWIGLTHQSIQHEVFYGMSDNRRAWWDNSRAKEFGYQPRHRSEDFADQVLAVDETPDAIADKFQGGTFCADEYSR